MQSSLTIPQSPHKPPSSPPTRPARSGSYRGHCLSTEIITRDQEYPRTGNRSRTRDYAFLRADFPDARGLLRQHTRPRVCLRSSGAILAMARTIFRNHSIGRPGQLGWPPLRKPLVHIDTARAASRAQPLPACSPSRGRNPRAPWFDTDRVLRTVLCPEPWTVAGERRAMRGGRESGSSARPPERRGGAARCRSRSLVISRFADY